MCASAAENTTAAEAAGRGRRHASGIPRARTHTAQGTRTWGPAANEVGRMTSMSPAAVQASTANLWVSSHAPTRSHHRTAPG